MAPPTLRLQEGTDDVGFVEVDRPEIADQRADIDWVFPETRTLISIVRRMNRENVRTPARSIANLEFHHTTALKDPRGCSSIFPAAFHRRV